MLDLIVRGGMVVDGTGAPARRADVGVRDGRVVAVGTVDEPARRVVDASGLVVSPGFVDIHTHYDAQLFWDPQGDPSARHGVTTVVGGNCGFTLAPLTPDDAEYVMRMMARVEGIPLPALEAGLSWDWKGFPDWLDRLDGRLGLNAGFLIGHSAVRRAVMGEDAVGGAATDEQVAEMVRLVEEAVAAGAMGVSSSHARSHLDGAGNPVPSRASSREELLALAEAVGRHPGTTVEFIPGGFEDADVDLMIDMSLAAGRPLNWNTLRPDASDRARYELQLGVSERAAARGARIAALTYPDTMRLRLSFDQDSMGLFNLPGWKDTMLLPHDRRLEALRDPAVRAHLRTSLERRDGGRVAPIVDWANMRVVETFTPETAAFEGRLVGEVAAEQGTDPFETVLDIVVADGLRTGLESPPNADDDESWRLRAEAWHSPHTIVGASDAGAHVDIQCAAVYPTALLGPAVRDRGLISLEEAVRQLTDVPARFYGLRDRGRVAEGWWADLVVFDPEQVGPNPTRLVSDLPGGASRVWADAVGVAHVFVNGEEVVAGGEYTGARPGRLLRSTADVETVTL